MGQGQLVEVEVMDKSNQQDDLSESAFTSTALSADVRPRNSPRNIYSVTITLVRKLILFCRHPKIYLLGNKLAIFLKEPKWINHLPPKARRWFLRDMFELLSILMRYL